MSGDDRKAWTRDELLLAINLYCKTPFGRIHIRNPEIINLATKLGRTPGSISYKLANFASLDPTLDRKGAENVSRLDREVWSEFFENWENMAYESETKFSEVMDTKEEYGQTQKTALKEGRMRESIVKTRTNQAFFRKMILSSYDEKCCITGINNPELLVASHIIPWSRDTKNRLNPMNGLCLNALHDRAFDKGLITIDEKHRVIISKKLGHEFFQKYQNAQITLPRRFKPDPKFLSYHRNEIFLNS